MKNRIYGLEYKLERMQRDADRDRELKDALAGIRALGTYKDYLGRDNILVTSGCNIKQQLSDVIETILSLSDMESAEASNERIPGGTGAVLLRTRGFAKAVTHVTHSVHFTDENCRTSGMCNGTEHKDSAVIYSRTIQDAPAMKQLLETAIKLCHPARDGENLSLR